MSSSLSCTCSWFLEPKRLGMECNGVQFTIWGCDWQYCGECVVRGHQFQPWSGCWIQWWDWCLWLHTHHSTVNQQPQMVNCTHCIPFQTFLAPEINYNVHDKELLMIFESFKRWQHYLEGSALPSTWSPITRTCNIFPKPSSSRGAKHTGLNTFQLLTLSYGLAQEVQYQTWCTY